MAHAFPTRKTYAASWIRRLLRVPILEHVSKFASDFLPSKPAFDYRAGTNGPHFICKIYLGQRNLRLSGHSVGRLPVTAFQRLCPVQAQKRSACFFSHPSARFRPITFLPAL